MKKKEKIENYREIIEGKLRQFNPNYGVSDSGEDVKRAVEAAVMWNFIYTPAEEGPLMPVSRSWNFVQELVHRDFSYVIFDWDNFFASYMAAEIAPVNYQNSAAPEPKQEATTPNPMLDACVSNYIQTVKSKTSAGFVPNFSSGRKSEDRTEPPIGAMVLEKIGERHGSAVDWLKAYVIDDLIEWNDWFIHNRMYDGLISLGSFNILDPANGGEGSMQNARFESGLDNSPMYDGEFFDKNGTHLMQLHDVGMSSMVAGEAYSLSRMLASLGRKADALRLRQRADALSSRIQNHLWDDVSGAFVNRFFNGTFYRRVSPTSFYPLMANAASDAQIEALVNGWLLNSTRFCIAPDGDFAGNSEYCYWGLPSISADDPAFPALGYWRGYVWGPMAQLTYWSLEAASEQGHGPGAAAAGKGRKALASQMRELMLSQWQAHRHICENFNPHRTADTSKGDCTGDQFYHWGALTGLLSILEGRK